MSALNFANETERELTQEGLKRKMKRAECILERKREASEQPGARDTTANKKKQKKKPGSTATPVYVKNATPIVVGVRSSASVS